MNGNENLKKKKEFGSRYRIKTPYDALNHSLHERKQRDGTHRCVSRRCLDETDFVNLATDVSLADAEDMIA